MAAHDLDHTPEPLYASLSDGGAVVSLHPKTLRRAIANGELPAYRFGKAIRIRLDELDAWAASKAMPHARLAPKRATTRGAAR